MNVVDFFLGSIPLLLQFYAETYRETDFKSTLLELDKEFNVPKIKTYDFVIGGPQKKNSLSLHLKVGGGSAGCVLAGRLSEQFNVLLLEAGGTPPPGTNVPYFTATVGRDPSINYFFKSVPQTNASLCCDGITHSHTGRMLGGSGSHNDLVHSRGSPQDYDNWAAILNDDSFKYTNVLKYFKKMETFVGQKFGIDGDEYYGQDGPIMVNTSVLPIHEVWMQAGRELGYDVHDPNGFQREGFAPMNVAVRNGQRSSSYIEYVKPHEESRTTLTVVRYANVSKILLDNDNKAYGVAYNRHGFPQIAYAEKEIILSAGAYSSPLLLMKSGIGPASLLNSAGIPVKVPLEAVGQNLEDHPAFIMHGFTVNDTSLFPKINPSDLEKIAEEFHNGGGILSIIAEGPQCFISSSKAEPGWPDLWIEINPGIKVDGEESHVEFINVIGRPQSKGQLTLDADKYRAGIRDDVQLALIDCKYLTHPDDIEVMLEGIEFIFRIIDTEPFKSLNLTYDAGPDPACGTFTYLSDDYWKCKIQQDTITWIHMVGTCSMGTESGDSSTSVVDTKFRVRGVSNLRVVDASVIPEVTNANLNAPVMMLAEKAAEDIINFYSTNDPTESIDGPTATTSTRTTVDEVNKDIKSQASGAESIIVGTMIVSVLSLYILLKQ